MKKTPLETARYIRQKYLDYVTEKGFKYTAPLCRYSIQNATTEIACDRCVLGAAMENPERLRKFSLLDDAWDDLMDTYNESSDEFQNTLKEILGELPDCHSYTLTEIQDLHDNMTGEPISRFLEALGMLINELNKLELKEKDNGVQ